jgi:hypothetical protein
MKSHVGSISILDMLGILFDGLATQEDEEGVEDVTHSLFDIGSPEGEVEG